MNLDHSLRAFHAARPSWHAFLGRLSAPKAVSSGVLVSHRYRLDSGLASLCQQSSSPLSTRLRRPLRLWISDHRRRFFYASHPLSKTFAPTPSLLVLPLNEQALKASVMITIWWSTSHYWNPKAKYHTTFCSIGVLLYQWTERFLIRLRNGIPSQQFLQLGCRRKLHVTLGVVPSQASGSLTLGVGR